MTGIQEGHGDAVGSNAALASVQFASQVPSKQREVPASQARDAGQGVPDATQTIGQVVLAGQLKVGST